MTLYEYLIENAGYSNKDQFADIAYVYEQAGLLGVLNMPERVNEDGQGSWMAIKWIREWKESEEHRTTDNQNHGR